MTSTSSPPPTRSPPSVRRSTSPALYPLAHQDVLIRADDTAIKSPSDLNSKKLCSVTGSTSAQNVHVQLAPKAQLQQYPTYSACLTGLQNKAIDALTTGRLDPRRLRLAGRLQGQVQVGVFKMTNENYGIGVRQRPQGQDQHGSRGDGVRRFLAEGRGQELRSGELQERARSEDRQHRQLMQAGPRCAALGGGAPGHHHTRKRGKSCSTFFKVTTCWAFWMTVKLTVLSAVGSLIWGTVLAAMRVGPVPLMRGFGTAYVNIVRNIPLTVIILFTVGPEPDPGELARTSSRRSTSGWPCSV